MQARAFILNEGMLYAEVVLCNPSGVHFAVPGSWLLAQPGPWLSLAYTDFKCVPRIYYATEQVPAGFNTLCGCWQAGAPVA